SSSSRASSSSNGRSDRGPSLEPEVLVGRHEEMTGDGRHLGYAWSDADQRRGLDDGREHHSLVHELLDLVEEGLAALPVHLARLVWEECIDVRVTAVGANPFRDHERLDARRCVAGGAASDADQTLELLVLVSLVEGGSLQRPETRADADGV